MAHVEPESLIGKKVGDPRVQAFMANTREDPRVDRFAEMNILEYPHSGMAIYLDKEQRVASMFFYGRQSEEHEPYAGPLPRDLLFSNSQVEVGRKLGSPEASGKGKGNNLWWERFECDGVYLHVEYSLGCESIHMVTVMSAPMAEGRI